MPKLLKTLAVAGLALSIGLPSAALAFEPGDWLVRAGATYVKPRDNNHEMVSVDSATTFTFNVTYMMTDIWAVEFLVGYPVEHDITLLDGTQVATAKQLPPTLSLQYHFSPDSRFQPYIGIGINYTTFSSEKTMGPLAGTDLSLSDSWGLGGQIGFDVMLGENWFFNVDGRYISIESDATLSGVSLGKVKVDPFAYGAHIGFRFK